MPRSHRSLVATVASVILFAALAGGLAGQEAEPGRGYPSTEWPFTGGNWSSSRYSTLDEINADTLDRLGAAWVAPLPGGAASRSTPVVQDGAVYLTGGANVFAFDARTGETHLALAAGPRCRPGGVVAGRRRGRRPGRLRHAQRGSARAAAATPASWCGPRGSGARSRPGARW